MHAPSPSPAPSLLAPPVTPPPSPSLAPAARPPSRPPSHPPSRPPSRPRTPNQSQHKAALLDALLEELQCSLCLEVLYEPRTLACQHTFCCDCLGTLVIPQYAGASAAASSSSSTSSSSTSSSSGGTGEGGLGAVLPPQAAAAVAGGPALARRGSAATAPPAAAASSSSVAAANVAGGGLRKTLECPLCRHVQELPAGGVAALARQPVVWNLADRYHRAMKRGRVAALAGGVLATQVRFRVAAADVHDLVRRWAASVSWVPVGFATRLRLHSFVSLLVPFYEYDVEVSTAYTAALSVRPSLAPPVQLTNSGTHAGTYRLLLCASARGADWCAFFSDSARLSEVPAEALAVRTVELTETPRDADTVWRRSGQERVDALQAAACERLARAAARVERLDDLHTYTRLVRCAPRLVCFPFYVGAYTYEGAVYHVAVNGFSGEVLAAKPSGVWSVLPSFIKRTLWG